MVLQALEGLSDREAAQQLACNIAWKVACGLALTDRGFHPSVLTLWRTRLRASARPERVVEAVRAVITQTGVLAGRQRRALDSTLLDDAVATQDTVTQLVAAIRRVRRLHPAAGALTLDAHDYDHDPGKPACAWDDSQARTRLVSALVGDARVVLDAVQGADLDAAQAEAVGLLGLVAGQDVEPGERPGSFRIARRVAADRVISTVDPDARHMHKSRSSYRDGYKAHLAVEPDTGLVTAAALTPANAADGPTGIGLLAQEPPRLQVLGDAA
jgi:IS5 family transposase